MIPYQGVRYHLKKQSLAGQKPKNAKKLFNLYYLSLQNAGKQIFGVDKRRFKILNTALEYDITTQVYFVFTMTILYNYIKDYATKKINYFDKGIDEEMVLVSIFDNISFGTSLATSAYMNKKRDIITNKM